MIRDSKQQKEGYEYESVSRPLCAPISNPHHNYYYPGIKVSVHDSGGHYLQQFADLR